MNDWMDAEARVDRAHDLYEQGRWVEAAAELRAAIDLNPYNAAWHFNLALTLEAMEQYDRAAAEFTSALKIDPDDVETLNCLGVNMTRQGQYAQALELFERIEKIDSTYEPSYCNRIATYSEIGEHDKAETMFYFARQYKDECPLCYYNMGNSLYVRGLYDRAIWCWKQTLRLDAKHLQANARIGDALWAKGDLAAARPFYEAEIRIDPKDVETILDLGEILMELGQADAAGERFRSVLEQDPDNADAHFCLGELALKRNQLARAEEQFRLVLRIERNYVGAHAKMARLLLAQGRARQAVKHILAELKRSEGDADMLQELGQMLIEANQTHRANSVLQHLVQLAPQDPYAQHNLAVSFFMLHRIDDGIRHCRKALKLKPEYPLALYNLALAHLHKGQITRARRYAAKAITMAPTDAQVQRLARELGGMGFWASLRNRLSPRRDKQNF